MGYTILNLPETTDPEVFNAIFSSAKLAKADARRRCDQVVWPEQSVCRVKCRQTERVFDVDFGHRKDREQGTDQTYYPQFIERLRREADRMSRSYQIFYCLENSIREMIVQRLEEQYGTDWWNAAVPEAVRRNAEANLERKSSRQVLHPDQELIDGEPKLLKTMGTFLVKCSATSEPLNEFWRYALRSHCKALAEDEELRLHLGLRDWFRQME